MIYKTCTYWDTDTVEQERYFWEEQDAIDYVNNEIREFLNYYTTALERNIESELPLCVDFETEYNCKSFRVFPIEVK